MKSWQWQLYLTPQDERKSLENDSFRLTKKQELWSRRLTWTFDINVSVFLKEFNCHISSDHETVFEGWWLVSFLILDTLKLIFDVERTNVFFLSSLDSLFFIIIQYASSFWMQWSYRNPWWINFDRCRAHDLLCNATRVMRTSIQIYEKWSDKACSPQFCSTSYY